MNAQTELQILRRIKCFIEDMADEMGQQRLSVAMAQFSHNIEDELPARVPGEEDPEVISSGSGDEAWEGGFDTTTE